MIKIKGIKLFKMDENGLVYLGSMSEEVNNLLRAPFKNALLKYEIQTKLGAAIFKTINEIYEFRNSLNSEMSKGKKKQTEDINKKVLELVNSELEIDAEPIFIGRLKGEDCSTIDFAYLKEFFRE